MHIGCYTFLAECNLPLRGSSSRITDKENGLFLGMLELLSKHNKVLEMQGWIYKFLKGVSISSRSQTRWSGAQPPEADKVYISKPVKFYIIS